MKNLELPKRFENAVTKLYKAFHENRLNANSCYACAVGNICDNQPEWNYYREVLGEISYESVTRKATELVKRTGYSPIQIINIEKVFLNAMGAKSFLQCPTKSFQTKELQFKGLCAVVEYLCELDGIPNIMDYKSLFETENDQPKKELSAVFI